MIRRIISIVVILCLISSLFVSCRGRSTLEATDQEKAEIEKRDLADVEVSESGRIHNEILRDFNEQYSLVETRNLDREIFAESFLTSVNKVLGTNNIVPELERNDIDLMLARIDSFKDRGIIDFYRHEGTNPEKLLDYLVEKGTLNLAAAEQARVLIEQLEMIDFPNKKKEINSPSLSSRAINGNFDAAIILAAEVADSSYAFWNELYKESRSALPVSGDSKNLIIDWWTIALILWDAVGALIGAALCGTACSIVFGAITSIIFVLVA